MLLISGNGMGTRGRPMRGLDQAAGGWSGGASAREDRAGDAAGISAVRADRPVSAASAQSTAMSAPQW